MAQDGPTPLDTLTPVTTLDPAPTNISVKTQPNRATLPNPPPGSLRFPGVSPTPEPYPFVVPRFVKLPQ